VRLRRGDPDLPPQVAYAIPRAAGGAVARNRLRRRLRAAVHELESELVPGGAYLLGAGPAAVTTSPADLRDALRILLRAVREPRV
jgi:ribonuclease P protein component